MYGKDDPASPEAEQPTFDFDWVENLKVERQVGGDFQNGLVAWDLPVVRVNVEVVCLLLQGRVRV